VTLLAVRIDYITRSREQHSLLIVIQRKKDVWSTSFVWLVKATAGYPVYNAMLINSSFSAPKGQKPPRAPSREALFHAQKWLSISALTTRLVAPISVSVTDSSTSRSILILSDCKTGKELWSPSWVA
jgi:hypothetical protein